MNVYKITCAITGKNEPLLPLACRVKANSWNKPGAWAFCC